MISNYKNNKWLLQFTLEIPLETLEKLVEKLEK